MKKILFLIICFSYLLIAESKLNFDDTDSQINLSNDKQIELKLKNLDSTIDKKDSFLKDLDVFYFLLISNPEIDFGYKYRKFNLSVPLFPKADFKLKDSFTSFCLGASSIQSENNGRGVFYAELKNGKNSLWAKFYLGAKLGITNEGEPYYGFHVTLGVLALNLSVGIDVLSIKDSTNQATVMKNGYMGFSLGLF